MGRDAQREKAKKPCRAPLAGVIAAVVLVAVAGCYYYPEDFAYSALNQLYFGSGYHSGHQGAHGPRHYRHGYHGKIKHPKYKRPKYPHHSRYYHKSKRKKKHRKY